MTDFCTIFMIECSANLLRAPLAIAQKCLHPYDEARCHNMCHTIPCRASLHRKAVRLRKPITAKPLIPRQFTADCSLVDTDIHGNFRLRQTPFIKSVNLASLISGQMVVSF